jgi:hypothetical protein
MIMTRRILILPFMALCSCAQCIRAQPLPDVVQNALQRAHDNLVKEAVSEEILREDRAGILAAYDVVKKLYAVRGLNEEATANALGERWGQIRVGKFALPKESSVGAYTFIRYGLSVETATERVGEPEFVKETAALIKIERPGIRDNFPVKDQDVLLAGLGEWRSLQEQRGFSRAEAYWGVMWVWESMRIGARAIGAVQDVASQAFKARLQNIGLLVVESDPKGATVAVDRELWDDPTNTLRWVPAGQREIRISKTGCVPLPLIEEFDIKPGARNPYKRKLHCPTITGRKKQKAR